MTQKKTIFFSLAFPMSARNLLRNPFYEYLSSKYRIVIFSEFSRQEEFIKEFRRDETYFEDLIFDPGKCRKSLIYKIHRWGDRYYFAQNKKVHGVYLNRVLYKSNWKEEKKTRIAGQLFTKFPKINMWMANRCNEMLVSPYYIKKIEKYKPDVVFSSHVYAEQENQLLLNAKLKAIPTIGLIHSWDNITSKGRINVMPDKIVLWNEVMKEEMKCLYNGVIDENNIFPVGIPQHDYIFNDNWKEGRAKFLKKLGADPDRKTIVYVSRGLKYQHYRERENLEVLIDGIAKNKFTRKSQLIIREIAGVDRLMCRDAIGKKPHVIFDVPDVSHRPNSNKNNVWTCNPKSTYHLGNLLMHSDVIINFGSTITIDSLYYDKPNIWAIYSPPKKYNKFIYGKIPDALRWSYIRPMVNLNAFAVPKEPKGLIPLINEALDDPKLLSKQRNEVLKKYCPYRDGKAGLRIAEVIESAFN
jgi:hypothetical protein